MIFDLIERFRLGSRLQGAGTFVTRYGLVTVLFWIGGMKFTGYEAEGIRPLVGWMYRFLSVQTFSSGLGTVEIIVGLLIAVRPVWPLAELTIIATASRPETTAWVQEMGAHHVIDHTRPMAKQVADLGLGAPAFVFPTTQTDKHLGEIEGLIAPQGRFGLIDDQEVLNIGGFQRKSVSVHWELMFTRSMFDTADVAEQGKVLGEVSRLVDEGVLRSTMTKRYSPINAANLKQAHAFIESNRARGKVVLEGFHPAAG